MEKHSSGVADQIREQERFAATSSMPGVEVDAITRQGIATGLFRGAAVRLEQHGECIFEGSWGHAVYTDGERIPLEPDWIFDIASISKIFTSTAILRLITQGRLELSTRVADVLGYGDSKLSRLLGSIDILSLLTHASGIHYWYPFYTAPGRSFEYILERILQEHPLPASGSTTVYSDINFMLLGKTVEALAGEALSKAMEKLVFGPLGLDRSSYRTKESNVVATEFGNRIEMGMVKDLGLDFDGWRGTGHPIRGKCDDGNCFYFFGGEAGHAGVFSCVKDLCVLGRLYIEEGRICGKRFIDRNLAIDACRDHGGGRGLGFQRGENYPEDGFGHGGFTGTYLYVNPESEIVLAVLTNRLHVPEPTRVNEYMKKIALAALTRVRTRE